MDINAHVSRQIDGGKLVHFNIHIHGEGDVSGAELGATLDRLVAGLPGVTPGPLGFGALGFGALGNQAPQATDYKR